jgi:hypothetical protein
MTNPTHIFVTTLIACLLGATHAIAATVPALALPF